MIQNQKFDQIIKLFHLSQIEIADELNISHVAISNYRKDRDIPSSVVLLLCEKFNINANWLLGLENNMFRENIELSDFESKELLENRIKFEIKRDFQNFQLQIITIYRSIAENEIRNKDDIISFIENTDLSFFAHISNFESLDRTKIKKEAIEFINSLTKWEIIYIIENRDDFLKTLGKNKDIFNKLFKMLKLI